MKKIKFDRVLASASLWCALAAPGCSSDGSGGAVGGVECAAICAKIEALRCPNDTPGLCAMQCKQNDMKTDCKAERHDFEACVSAATGRCSQGYAVLEGCNMQDLALSICIARSNVCKPNCSSATCQNPSDQCGGNCTGICGNGESGCKYDIHCNPGFACIANQDATTTCLPATCAFRVLAPPLCGSPGAECGEKCPTCVPRCENLMCGPDPNCGQSCGTCAEGEYCSGLGRCVRPTCDPPIMVPDGDGGLRPIKELDGSFNTCPDRDP